MTIYVVIWFLIIAPYLIYNKKAGENAYRSYAIYIFFCLLILIGLRHVSVGADTKQYQHLYYDSVNQLQFRNYDRGYYQFANFFFQLGFSFQAYNFIVAAILVGSLVSFYATYSKNLSFKSVAIRKHEKTQ